MGILTHLVVGLTHLMIVAIDVYAILYVAHALAVRWPTVQLLQTVDRYAAPVLQELWRIVNRSNRPGRLPLFWESPTGAMFPLGLLLLRTLLAGTSRLAG